MFLGEHKTMIACKRMGLEDTDMGGIGRILKCNISGLTGTHLFVMFRGS